MTQILKSHPRLTVAGVVGLTLFLTLCGRSFMREVRPQPLDRDELTARALDFAESEGWSGSNQVSWTYPIEGDDADAVRASGGTVEDRETLPDPGWETVVVTDPRTISRMFDDDRPPSPLLWFALTPGGDVVQYIVATAPIAAQTEVQGNQSRSAPYVELSNTKLFEVAPEESLPVTAEERHRSIETARAFFDRHGIDRSGDPVSVVVRKVRDKARVAYLTWERPGPGGTTDVARLIVWRDRVSAYDRDLRPTTPVVAGSDLRELFVPIVGTLTMLVFLVGAAMILVLVAIKRRRGEINLRATLVVFLFYMSLALLTMMMVAGQAVGGQMRFAGTRVVWFTLLPIVIFMPLMFLAFALVTAGAWSVGESESYAVWPKNLILPVSSALRGRLRSAEYAAPVTIGYLWAFAGLGVDVLLGLMAPHGATPSIASLTPLTNWPVFLFPPVAALMTGLTTTIVGGMFVMTYAKRWTRRLWPALALGTFNAWLQLCLPQPSFSGDYGIAVAWSVGLGLATSIIFARFGPLASFVSIFVYLTFDMSYPLVLTGNASHAASGAWSMALGLLPAGIATLGYLRPKEYGGEAAVPAHVRRVLDRLRIGEEFEVARRVQAGLLPKEAPEVLGFEVAGICVPANEVGGDYFDYFKLADDKLAVAVGDVSGKGVGAAIYMTLTKSYMVTQVPHVSEPVRVLSRVNGHLKRNMARGTFVTMAYAVLESGAGRLTYTRAGHNPPLLIHANGEGDFLSAPGIALGSASSTIFESITKAETVDLRPGDLFLLYTDGVTEAMNLRNDEYGEDRLVARATSSARAAASASETVDALLKDVRSFTGRAPQHDDITIVAIRVR